MIAHTTSMFYADGRLITLPVSTGLQYLSQGRQGYVWVDLENPTPDTIAEIAAEFGLDEQTTADMGRSRLRTGLTSGATALVIALMTVRPAGDTAPVQFGSIRMVVGKHFILTLRQGSEITVDALRQRVTSDPRLLALGLIAVVYAMLDDVITAYEPMVARLERDVVAVEHAIFDTNQDSARRIYHAVRAVMQFQRVTRPLADALAQLLATPRSSTQVLGRLDAEARAYLVSTEAQIRHVVDELADLQRLLEGLQQVNLTLVGSQQTDQRQEVAQKISAWAAIMAIPTIVTGVYGMNFQHMPELAWAWGYPSIIVVMVLGCLLVYSRFKRSGWL